MAAPAPPRRSNSDLKRARTPPPAHALLALAAVVVSAPLLYAVSRQDGDGAATPQVNMGALMMRGPHAGFLNGTAKIYMQHVRKAAGTTLCALLRANANATLRDCQAPAPINISDSPAPIDASDGGPDQPIRRPATMLQYKDPTRDFMENLLSFGSLEEVASYLDKEGLEVVASESDHMPAYVDDHLGGADPSWVFVTSMREPISRILSSLHYEYKPLMKEWNEAVGAADPFTADKQKQLVYSHALGYLQWNRFNCSLDNYATRVFSHTCAKPKLTEEDFQLAEHNLRRFDICFVSEWFAEMAPLVKFTLGMQFVDSAPRNVKGFGPRRWRDGRAEVSPPLPRSLVAQRTSAKTDAVKFFGKNSDMLRHLRDLNAFDMRLYRVCKAHARELVDKYLFEAANRTAPDHAAAVRK